MSSNEDLATLTSFLDELKLILQAFINHYIEEAIPSNSKFVGSIPIFRNSFPAARRALEISINRLNEPDQELMRKLEDHGLRGQSLLLKMEIVNVEKKPLLDAFRPERKKSLWSNLKDRFLGFFKAADIPLESLSDCIPGLGLALEFKKAVEHVIE